MNLPLRSMLHTGLVSSGRIAIAGSAFIITLILIKHFNPEQYGTLVTVTTFMALLPMFMDFGTTFSIVRFGALFGSAGDNTSMALIFKGIFWLRIIIGLLIVAAGLACAGWISTVFFHDDGAAAWVSWAFLGSFAMAMVLFVQAILQTHERFIAYSMLNMCEGLGKLACIAAAVYLFATGVSGVVMVYVLVPPVLFIIGAVVIKWSFLTTSRRPGDPQVLRRLFHYSKWIIVANICMIVFSNMDILMLAAMRGTTETGLYGGAFKLAAVVQVLTSSITVVLMPKVAKLRTKERLTRFLLRSSMYLTGLILLMVPGVLAGRQILLTVAGAEYIAAVPIFRLLYLDNLLTFLLVPLLLWIFAINRPVIYAVVGIAELLLNLVGNMICIPAFGALGAAWVTLLARLVSGGAGGYL
ncbi:oligosaccharide flippase family protein, partial [bacterium]|nr:oligosaccharide flippase family protein [candidate division CSSED10-310 bacterium]